MIGVLLVMIVGGIGLAQAVSDPRQVTLRWLRLGGIIALCLLAVAWVVTVRTGQIGARVWDVSGGTWLHGGLAVVMAAFVTQLIAVQRAYRGLGRLAAGAGYVLAAGLVTLVLLPRADHRTGDTAGQLDLISQNLTILNPTDPADHPDQTRSTWNIVTPEATPGTEEHLRSPPGTRTGTIQGTFPGTFPREVWVVLLSQGLLGGFLMTMLLGHAYLTAGGEMTQAPFRRLVILLAILLALRVATSGAGALWPYLAGQVDMGGHMAQLWDTVMITARFLVGFVVPGVFMYMIYDCVMRRANQSATGILYVATVLVILGEGMALALSSRTGLMF